MGTISKALELLGFFSTTKGEIGLSEFVRLAKRDKATVHRHLSELEENGYLEQHPVSRAYRLGPALLRLASVREATFPTRLLLAPIVVELSETVGELAHASLLQGDVLTPVFHADPRLHGTQVHFDPAEVLPLHATSSGIAVLAFSSPALLQRVLNRPLTLHTSKTVTQSEHLRALVEEVRETGLAAKAGTFDEDVGSQAVPLFGDGGRVIGALAVAEPLSRFKPERQQEIAMQLKSAARHASLSLGALEAELPRFFNNTQ